MNREPWPWPWPSSGPWPWSWCSFALLMAIPSGPGGDGGDRRSRLAGLPDPAAVDLVLDEIVVVVEVVEHGWVGEVEEHRRRRGLPLERRATPRVVRRDRAAPGRDDQVDDLDEDRDAEDEGADRRQLVEERELRV